MNSALLTSRYQAVLDPPADTSVCLQSLKQSDDDLAPKLTERVSIELRILRFHFTGFSLNCI